MTTINLPEIKKSLLSGELMHQVLAVKAIKNQVELTNSGIKRAEFIDEMMKFDITRILCTQTLATSSSDLMISILNLIPELSESKHFFRREFVQETVDMLLKIGLMINQKNDNEKQLRSLNMALTIILSGAQAAGHSLTKISEPAHLIKYINEMSIFDQSFSTSASRLACIILSDDDLTKNTSELSSIIQLFKKTTNYMVEIVIAQKQISTDDFYFFAIDILSNLCWNGARITRVFWTTDEFTEFSSIMIKKLTTITLEYLSPFVRTTDLSNELSKIIVKNFVNCLNEIYKIEFEGLDVFSEDLAGQKCLKYLVKHHKNSSDYFKDDICILLSKIVKQLSVKYLAVDGWTGGPGEFEKYFFQSFKSLDVSKAFDSWMLLGFFHKNATDEFFYDIDLYNVIDYIEKKSDIPSAILKVLWTLFAELSFESSTEKMGNPRTNEGLLKLINMIEKCGIENCYFQHSMLVHFVIINHQFSMDFQRKIVELWLERDDVSALADYVCRDKILNILLNIVETNPDKSIVEKSYNEIKQLLKLELNREKTKEIIWHKLSNVLISYTKETETNIKIYLKLINDLPQKKLSKELLFRCTISLHNIFKKDDLEIETKILIVHQLCVMLRQGLLLNDSRIVGIFVENKKTIEELCHQANLWGNDEKFSNICFECLKQIFLSQVQFDEKCNDPVIFPLINVVNSLRRLSTENSAIWFLCFILQEKFNYPVVQLEEFPDESEARKIILKSIYPAVVTVFEREPSKYWTNIFICLRGLLEVCRRRRYKKTLKSCLDYSGNVNVINSAIMSKYYQNDFFNFTTLWLDDCVKEMTPVVEYYIDNKIKVIENSNEFNSQLPFIKMISDLKNYLNERLAAKDIDAESVEELLKNQLLVD